MPRFGKLTTCMAQCTERVREEAGEETSIEIVPIRGEIKLSCGSTSHTSFQRRLRPQAL